MNLPTFLTLETVMRVISMVVFLGIILYAYAPNRRTAMQQHALNILEDQIRPPRLAPRLAPRLDGDEHG